LNGNRLSFVFARWAHGFVAASRSSHTIAIRVCGG
jgi:hypothetical protein